MIKQIKKNEVTAFNETTFINFRNKGLNNKKSVLFLKLTWRLDQFY